MATEHSQPLTRSVHLDLFQRLPVVVVVAVNVVVAVGAHSQELNDENLPHTLRNLFETRRSPLRKHRRRFSSRHLDVKTCALGWTGEALQSDVRLHSSSELVAVATTTSSFVADNQLCVSLILTLTEQTSAQVGCHRRVL